MQELSAGIVERYGLGLYAVLEAPRGYIVGQQNTSTFGTDVDSIGIPAGFSVEQYVAEDDALHNPYIIADRPIG